LFSDCGFACTHQADKKYIAQIFSNNWLGLNKYWLYHPHFKAIEADCQILVFCRKNG
jgi:hypothetical protein